MNDLISRADAIEAVRLETGKLGRGLLGRGDILDIISALPSAKPKVVRVEYSPFTVEETSTPSQTSFRGTQEVKIIEIPSADRTQGEWIDAGQYPFDKCSICGQTVDTYDKWSYCPNCGARMESK